jgi:peptidyl-dipeptidase Dcp
MMMRTCIFLLISGIILLSCQKKEDKTMTSENPFFEEYDTPFGIPPFDKIKTEHYLPAILKGIEVHQKEIEAITSTKENPTFGNTIEALEYSGSDLQKVLDVYNLTLSANKDEALQKVAKEVAPILSSHEDDIMLNNVLFQRVEVVYSKQEELSLNTEEKMLLEETHKSFVRNGANLEQSEKEQLKKINEKLAILTLQFSDNLLAEDNNWKLVIENEEDLSGLPDMIISSAAEAAEEAGFPGKWVITLHKPSWIPFLQYSAKRELREKVYKAWMNRGNNNNEFDNKEILTDIIALRGEKAELLGYDTWANYILDNNMAKTTDAVYGLLNKLWKRTVPMAEHEREAMQVLIDKEGGNFKLASWDWWYYTEKVRKEKYDLDDEILRPYFELNAVRKGLFYVLEKLYGIKMIERKDIPKPHPDASAFEVQENDGTHIGVLFMDFYPRSSKNGGAWMDAYRKQQVRDGEFITPVITNVFNFSKPAGDQPALLTFDEASTMFHEMGHALHGLLSNCTYRSISGTAVPIDFVELPSQIMENWAAEPEVLKMYAKHYETGEPIPDALIDKMVESSKFNQGFSMTERISASLLDLSWHNTSFSEDIDPLLFEENEMDKIGLMDEIIPRYRSPYFAHIFTGDMYSAGYYSYLWAEVLDADAFNAFKESGNIFNPEMAMNFREHILSKGGTEESMELYRKFRGSDPDINALLVRTGLD